MKIIFGTQAEEMEKMRKKIAELNKEVEELRARDEKEKQIIANDKCDTTELQEKLCKIANEKVTSDVINEIKIRKLEETIEKQKIINVELQEEKEVLSIELVQREHQNSQLQANNSRLVYQNSELENANEELKLEKERLEKSNGELIKDNTYLLNLETGRENIYSVAEGQLHLGYIDEDTQVQAQR